MSEEHQSRLKKLRDAMRLMEVEAVLISSAANRRYYSGFEARDGMINESSGSLLICQRGQWLLTDSRYTEAAKKEAPLFKVLEYRRGLGRELSDISALKKKKTLYFEADFISYATLENLAEALPDHELSPLPFNLEKMRSVKSDHEIKIVAKALKITETAVGSLWEKMEEGLTEREAAFFLEAEFRRLGAEGPSFETIVASGPNAALPHAVPGNRKMRDGDMVIIDCGAQYKGYAADISRTKIIGTAKPWQKEIYTIVQQAQRRAIALIKPGAVAADVDAAARLYIKECGYGDYFGHGLGHGVGLAIHEAPSLSPRNSEALKSGEIVTVEPGIYLPGKGGVRLEQLVLVTDKGCRVMNRDKNFYDFT